MSTTFLHKTRDVVFVVVDFSCSRRNDCRFACVDVSCIGACNFWENAKCCVGSVRFIRMDESAYVQCILLGLATLADYEENFKNNVFQVCDQKRVWFWIDSKRRSGNRLRLKREKNRRHRVVLPHVFDVEGQNDVFGGSCRTRIHAASRHWQNAGFVFLFELFFQTKRFINNFTTVW